VEDTITITKDMLQGMFVLFEQSYRTNNPDEDFSNHDSVEDHARYYAARAWIALGGAVEIETT
jgi:hypothetical protein